MTSLRERVTNAYYVWGWRLIFWAQRGPALLDALLLALLALALLVLGIGEFLLVVVYHQRPVPIDLSGGAP